MRKMLFTTKSCPNCPPAKALLGSYEDIEILDAHDNMDLVSNFGIRAVPSLVIQDNENVKLYIGLDDIKKYINEA